MAINHTLNTPANIVVFFKYLRFNVSKGYGKDTGADTTTGVYQGMYNNVRLVILFGCGPDPLFHFHQFNSGGISTKSDSTKSLRDPFDRWHSIASMA